MMCFKTEKGPTFQLTFWTEQGYTVWYNTKFGSQNFGYQLWCLFVIYVMFPEIFQCGSNNNVIKYCCLGIPHNWDLSFGKFGGLPTVVAFPENQLTHVTRQEQINCFKYERQRVHRSVPHHWMYNSTRHSVLKVITIRIEPFPIGEQ